MFFSFDLTVPANTAASAPLVTEVTLPPGIIDQVDVQFPTGCVGLVHTLCRRGSHQVWPTNDGGDFSSNGIVISWRDAYELDDAPFVLRLFAWNLDDTFAHTVTWRFSLLSFPPGPQQQIAQERFAAAVSTLEVDV